MSTITIGVLALQGAFIEHEKSFQACGAKTRQVRLPDQLKGLDGLVIPGGESTTMGKLLVAYELIQPIKKMAEEGIPIFGTCAGMIMLAKKIINSDQPSLNLMDIVVERNAFGRQVESFEADINISEFGESPYNAVFIRAPYIFSVDSNVKAMASYNEKIVLARQDNFLAAAFHPELTDDLRLHKYFMEMVTG